MLLTVLTYTEVHTEVSRSTQPGSLGALPPNRRTPGFSCPRTCALAVGDTSAAWTMGDGSEESQVELDPGGHHAGYPPCPLSILGIWSFVCFSQDKNKFLQCPVCCPLASSSLSQCYLPSAVGSSVLVWAEWSGSKPWLPAVLVRDHSPGLFPLLTLSWPHNCSFTPMVSDALTACSSLPCSVPGSPGLL